MHVPRHRVRLHRSVTQAAQSRPTGRPCAALALALSAVVLAGCASDGSGDRSRGSVSAGSGGGQGDDVYLVPPVEAIDLGYRLDWQANPALGNVDQVSIEGDAIFLMEDRNFLTRVQPRDGHRLWRVPVAREHTEVMGVGYVPDINRVYVLTGSNLLEFDGATGNQLARQELAKIANTEPVVYGGTILYGARNGQLVWHSYPVGHMWRSYQLSPSIQVKPTVGQQTVAVVGSAGGVYALDAGSAQQIWSQSLLEPAVAPATIGRNAVFVAGLDQYIRAYDLNSGRTIWSELTASPLRTSPVLIGETLYQQVPGVGLISYEAVPVDQFGGVRNWVVEGLNGTVLTETNGRLYVWDNESHTLSVVDPARGSIINQLQLPRIRTLFATNVTDGDLYALGQDSRLLRLTPVQ